MSASEGCKCHHGNTTSHADTKYEKIPAILSLFSSRQRKFYISITHSNIYKNTAKPKSNIKNKECNSFLHRNTRMIPQCVILSVVYHCFWFFFNEWSNVSWIQFCRRRLFCNLTINLNSFHYPGKSAVSRCSSKMDPTAGQHKKVSFTSKLVKQSRMKANTELIKPRI